ncbi:F0F1 ATP synthase subunit I [Musicola paradisiaca]|uniref:ATP synthase I chain n=1 Tax=Musicola paradisiaca (strain Ech703) TaxID=579405 RepID=C6C6D0_MUSP7|nr:F0F1 ATP synthase subunit I [Musicola paradisiaca]ACS87739.1 ATP synthase I chain [Musicola paradisiaca Ech703]
MSVYIYSGRLARWSLLVQMVTLLVISAAFGTVSSRAAMSALGGGLAAWLPNMVFMMFALRHQAHNPSEGRIAWSFVIGEALKVLFTIALLVVALGGFHATFFPLGLTYFFVLVMQIAAPAVINRYRS